MDYLVDVDGKLVTDDTVYVEIGASGNQNACVLSLCSANQELSEIIAAWGKTLAVFSSQELGTTDYTITIGDNFVNIVEEEATPGIIKWPLPEGVYYRSANDSHKVLVNQDGKALLDQRGKCVAYNPDDGEVNIRIALEVPSGWEVIDTPRVSDTTSTYLWYSISISNGVGTISPTPTSYD